MCRFGVQAQAVTISGKTLHNCPSKHVTQNVLKMKQIDKFHLNILGICKSLSSVSKRHYLVVLLESSGFIVKSCVYTCDQNNEN
jgi:hypothetical protein